MGVSALRRAPDTIPIVGKSLRIVVCLAALAGLLAGAQPADASKALARNASFISLKVNKQGYALVTYQANGRRHRTLVWGAVNARPPSRTVPQVKFRIDYTGGWGAFRKPNYWRTFRNACRPYDGPALVWRLAACKAPDGSYWAVQRFRRITPAYGVPPFEPRHGDVELHVSHWTGPLPVLEVYQDWVWSNYRRELFGRFTYRGKPVHGFGTTLEGATTDSYGRLLTLDTYNSAYGPGWKRENSFVTHKPLGNWCYHFVPHERPSDYPPGPTRPPGNGERYRLAVMGPGVTPVIVEHVNDIGPFDPNDPADVAHEEQMNALRRHLSRLDPDHCQRD